MDLGTAWSTLLLAVPSAGPSVWERPCWLSAVWLRLRLPSLVCERERLPSVVCERERLPSKEVMLEPEAVRERTRRVMLAEGTEGRRRRRRRI